MSASSLFYQMFLTSSTTDSFYLQELENHKWISTFNKRLIREFKVIFYKRNKTNQQPGCFSHWNLCVTRTESHLLESCPWSFEVWPIYHFLYHSCCFHNWHLNFPNSKTALYYKHYTRQNQTDQYVRNIFRTSYEHLKLVCGFHNCLLGTMKWGDSSRGQFFAACQCRRPTLGAVTLDLLHQILTEVGRFAQGLWD